MTREEIIYNKKSITACELITELINSGYPLEPQNFITDSEVRSEMAYRVDMMYRSRTPLSDMGRTIHRYVNLLNEMSTEERKSAVLMAEKNGVIDLPSIDSL